MEDLKCKHLITVCLFLPSKNLGQESDMITAGRTISPEAKDDTQVKVEER